MQNHQKEKKLVQAAVEVQAPTILGISSHPEEVRHLKMNLAGQKKQTRNRKIIGLSKLKLKG